MITLEETHKIGHVSIENQEIIDQYYLPEADFGIQIAPDGRVWICINGTAFIRFKPRQIMESDNELG